MRRKEEKKKKSVVYYLTTLAVFVFAVTLLPVMLESYTASQYKKQYKEFKE